MGLLVLSAVGVLLCWPGRPGTDSWWLGPGRRSSRQGRVRQVVGDVLAVVGLAGCVVAQFVLAGPRGVGGVVLLVVELVLIGLLARMVVRRHIGLRRTASGGSGGGR